MRIHIHCWCIFEGFCYWGRKWWRFVPFSLRLMQVDNTNMIVCQFFPQRKVHFPWGCSLHWLAFIFLGSPAFFPPTKVLLQSFICFSGVPPSLWYSCLSFPSISLHLSTVSYMLFLTRLTFYSTLQFPLPCSLFLLAVKQSSHLFPSHFSLMLLFRHQ